MRRQILPQRILLLLVLIALLAILTPWFLSDSSVPHLDRVKQVSHSLPKYLPKVSSLRVPGLRIPFRPAAHTPPVQVNSTSGDARWFSDWKWLHPFSSTVTLDENRALLPPLGKRPPIYTFYDASEKKDDGLRAAESDLLLVWRRAWWAKGFRPIVLGRAEAMSNPLYQSLQSLTLNASVEKELTRWLAWEHMGAGILVDWLAVPMGAYNDPLLSYLRKGDYPTMIRYEGLRNGIFSGEKTAATQTLKAALSNGKLSKTANFLDAVPKEMFEVDAAHDGIAVYDREVIKDRYRTVSEKFGVSEADGLRSLCQLISSHLHTTFQNIFSNGISILNPTDKRLIALVQPALQIASYLAECVDSPMPSSCPPNRPKCKPCVAAHPLPIASFSVYRNTSSLYVIGTVPHPYTLATLESQRTDLDAAYVRRHTDRDRWIVSATKELLGTGVGTGPRLLALKEAIAGPETSASSIWLTPEKEVPTDLDWHLGFALPKNVTNKGYSNSPIPGSKPNLPSSAVDEKQKLSVVELARETQLLETARKAISSPVRQQQSVCAMVEAWSLADTEAWRFVRAFNARSRVERLKWEEEEKSFAGGALGGRSPSWARWLDGLRS